MAWVIPSGLGTHFKDPLNDVSREQIHHKHWLLRDVQQKSIDLKQGMLHESVSISRVIHNGFEFDRYLNTGSVCLSLAPGTSMNFGGTHRNFSIDYRIKTNTHSHTSNQVC